ncbi:type II toxin-antitoxin system VapB family antitoxin [Streptomyces sp. 5-10]|nr:type II toxin-antitoxin system VapB family antitoxin [Streptomyces sp. 5-10]
MGMVSHMKTTVEISDALLDEARRTAREEGTTLRALIEEGLRSVLAQHAHRSHSFTLQDASVGGEGLQPGAQGASWEQLRGLAYGDRL